MSSNPAGIQGQVVCGQQSVFSSDPSVFWGRGGAGACLYYAKLNDEKFTVPNTYINTSVDYWTNNGYAVNYGGPAHSSMGTYLATAAGSFTKAHTYVSPGKFSTMTVSLWAKIWTLDTGYDQMFWSVLQNTSSGGNIRTIYYQRSSGLFRYAVTGGQILSSESVVEGKWYHLCAVNYSSTERAFYVDGVMVGKDSASHTALNMEKNVVGDFITNESPGRHLYGQVTGLYATAVPYPPDMVNRYYNWAISQPGFFGNIMPAYDGGGAPAAGQPFFKRLGGCQHVRINRGIW